MAFLRNFLKTHYKHFNSAVVVDASEAYLDLLEKKKGKMFMTLAGAMSTAELGKSLAEMIRQDKVHAITCTGANLEEDVFNLVANKLYKRVPDYRHLTPEQEEELGKAGFNRVTDTCIPEEEAFRKIEGHLLTLWQRAESEGKRYFPHEFFYQLLLSDKLKGEYQIEPKDSWLLAAAQKNLPIFVPGWEDSTLGNVIVARTMQNKLKSTTMVKTGLDYMHELVGWYKKEAKAGPIGFFQIGGGIAGDFPICAVPLMTQDLGMDVARWGYFCQISDSTTSYGSYSGAVPNEKITWGKLGIDTPKFVIESDATIVAPLMFGYILDW
ncbi:MAG: deoxyhypusine synthase family protein [Candidatus Marsarchaeota archaeon]|nr:deoxyhypusine synthase family protein [Candidatus Marsarchaeota archaeon]